jgi:hypothetical protein
MKSNELAENVEHAGAEERHRQLHRYNNEVAELLEKKRKKRLYYSVVILLFLATNIFYIACR